MNVWYVSYGSNLCKDRFMCYIQGGKPEGSVKIEKGCRDQTPPEADEKVDLMYPLYFAKERSKWGEGGVAFISHDKLSARKTIGRMYLITDEQFEDVVAQENNQDKLSIDLHKVIENGYQDINKSWYGRILFLGYMDKAPMFTFTNPNPMNDEKFTLPPASYLKIISRGLMELGLHTEEIIRYFNTCMGINGKFTTDKLHQYIFSERG